MIPKNPAKNVELPKVIRHKANVFNKQEITQLFEAVKNTDLELAVHILIFLGLRRGEAVALRWENVNFEKKTVNIIENIVPVAGELILKKPKSDSGIRELSIPNNLLKMMKKAYTEYLWRKNIDSSITDYVIVKKDGQPYHPDWFSEKIQTFLTKAGLKQLCCHEFRHTSATLMLQLGIVPKVAQKRLGHADFSTTMDIYSHVLEDMEQEVADKFDEAFADDKNKFRA